MKIRGTHTEVKQVVVDVNVDELFYSLRHKLKYMFPKVETHNTEYKGGKVYRVHFDDHRNEWRPAYERESSEEEKKYEEYETLLTKLLRE